jgi:hypothetical protein
MALFRGQSKRRVVTAGIVAVSGAVFAWQWAAAPRVHADPHVERQLASVPPHELYLGTSFEGLALRRVQPFLYSNCRSGRARASLRCDWVRVDGARVSGSDQQQVRRARDKLRPVR